MIEIMKMGCSKPGPSIFHKKRKDEIKLYLHDKRGVKTSLINRDIVNLMPMISKAAENLGINYSKM